MGKFDPIRDLQDLTGKVVIVTGATSGIGYSTAQQLFERARHIYRGTERREGEGRDCAEGLGPGNEKSIFHKLSLDDPRDAKASAEAFLLREKRLDIFVNNAASFLTPYKEGALRCDNDMIINQVSPFVFTNTLLPIMKKTASEPGADARIVIVASNAHEIVKQARFSSREDLNVTYPGHRYESFKRYALTKFANMLWTRELARRLSLSSGDGGANILVVSLHPGGVASEGLQTTLPKLAPWPLSKVASGLIGLFMLTKDEGAYNSTFAAASPVVRREAAKYHGSYLVPGQKIGKPTKLSMDEQLAKDLWELQERILTETGI